MATKYVMKVIDLPNNPKHEVIGQYLKSMDWTKEPAGDGQFTYNVNDAMKFDSPADAMRYWKTIHPTVPKRPDGKPNRPLSALTITIEPFEEELGIVGFEGNLRGNSYLH